MTISTTTLRNSYSGNGSTTAFAYTYPINTTSEITVIERSALSVETVKAEGTGSTNYGIADNGAAGGTITMVTAPAAGTTLIILRNTSLTQETDYVANDPFPAETHEDALDKLQMQTQELQEELDRSIKISRTNTMTSTEFTVAAADRASKVLAFDSSGELSITQEIGTFKGSSATTTTAAFVQRDIVKGTTTAQLNNIYICIADSAIGDTLTDTDHFALLVDAFSAAASATTATTKASEAATSASTATTKAAEAVTARDASVVAKDASVAAKDLAVTAKNEAVTAKNAAETALDSFDDLYLGAKSSAPSVDNDGDALTTGDQYFNSSTNQLNVWNGSAWIAITTSEVTLAGTETLTNKTLTAPKINENVAVTSTATELNLLDGKAATNLALIGKQEGTNFSNSILVGHATTGTLDAAGQNTGIGIGSLDAITSGDNNTAIGFNTLTTGTTATNNVAIGSSALKLTTSGHSNVAIGANALIDNTEGLYNNAIGLESLANNTEGDSNMALGYQSLTTNVTGSNNLGLGFRALKLNTASYNIGLGRDSGDNITSGSGNVIIGTVDAASATGDRQLMISGYDGSTTTTWISGNSDGNVSVPANLNLSGSNKELRFYEGANYVGFEAPALSADKIWVLPAADGSANQVLKTDGSGNLGFATASSGGKILQVVTASESAARTITSTSYVNSSNGLSVDITPAATSSKIYIIVSLGYFTCPGGQNLSVTVFRDSTNLAGGDGGIGLGMHGGFGEVIPFAAHVVDSPSSTSELTYQVYAKVTGSSGQYGNANSKATITAMEIGA